MRVNGIDLLPFMAKQRTIIAAIVLCAPLAISARELIAAVYPDPDLEPNFAQGCIRMMVRAIRAQWRDKTWRLAARKGRNGGYYLERIHAGN